MIGPAGRRPHRSTTVTLIVPVRGCDPAPAYPVFRRVAACASSSSAVRITVGVAGGGSRSVHSSAGGGGASRRPARLPERSEEHTSELQSLMRISYAVFCLEKKMQQQYKAHHCNINT